jgi:hypothetical protein
MTLERRGKWWHGTEAADIDAFLLQHCMGPPDVDVPHRVVHARCAACGGTVFWLAADESRAINRLCVIGDGERCPEEDVHFICGCGRYYDSDSDEDCVCPCGEEHFEVAVGFGHTLVAMEQGASRKNGKVMPFVNWIYVAARCVDCGLIGLYSDWHERDCEPPEHFYALV